MGLEKDYYRDYAIATLSDLLENGRSYIPSFFLRDLNGRQTAKAELLSATESRIEAKEYPTKIPKLRAEVERRLRYAEYTGVDLAREILWSLYEKESQKPFFESLRLLVENYSFQDHTLKMPTTTATTARTKIFKNGESYNIKYDLAMATLRDLVVDFKATFQKSGAFPGTLFKQNGELSRWLEEQHPNSTTCRSFYF